MVADSWAGKRIVQIVFIGFTAMVLAASALSYGQTYDFFKVAFTGQLIWAHIFSITVQFGPTVCRVLGWDMRESKPDLSGGLYLLAIVLELFDAGTNVAWYAQQPGPKWANAQWYDVARDIFIGFLLVLVTQAEEVMGLLVTKIIDLEGGIRKIMGRPVPSWMKWADVVATGASSRPESKPEPPKDPPKGPPPPPEKPNYEKPNPQPQGSNQRMPIQGGPNKPRG